MQQHRHFSFIGFHSLAAMGIICALSTASCKDSGAERWDGKKDAPQGQTQAAEQASAPAALPEAGYPKQKELLDYMIFSVGEMVRRQAGNAAWRDEVRDMYNKLEDYYNFLEEKGQDIETRIKLGLFLADSARDLSAYQKAVELYEHTLKNWESQPEETRGTVASRRLRSSIANGMGSCYLMQRKATEAMPFYEKALEIDLGLFNELAPENNAPLPTGANLSPDLAQAAEDILSSYRCLGECQLFAEDPEEARDTFKKGQELINRMKNLTPGISMQLVRLLSSLGNLESSCGQLRQAQQAWVGAATIAQKLLQAAPSLAIQAQAARYYRELSASIKSIAKDLQQESQSAEQNEGEGQPAPAPEQ